MDELEAVITNDDMPFEAAVRYFGERIPVTAGQFYRLAEKYRALAFTVSGYTTAQILRKFYDEILSAIENGTTMEAFRTEMNGFLEAQGYEGLTPFQADNIFRTNVQTAYQAGHYEQMSDPEVLKLRPYWQYDAVQDRKTRPSHKAMDGKVFRADSPVWDTWYPPNGFRCRCTVHSLSERQVRERGLPVEDEVPSMERLPDGRLVNLQPDPQFSTNPAKTRFDPELKGYPQSLVKAYRTRQKNGPNP